MRPFLLALGIVGAPLGALYQVGHARAFALHELVVTTEDGGHVSRAWVHGALNSFRGHNLPRLPLAYVDRALRKHPWVAAVDARKDLPGRLSVKVVEKRAVALLRRSDYEGSDYEGQFFYLDAAGAVIAPFTPRMTPQARDAVDLLLVSGAVDGFAPRALRLAAEIEAAAPSWAPGLSEIEVLGEEDFRLWSADLPFPLLVRADSLAVRARQLETLLPQVARRYPDVGAIDLRFQRRIILQTVAGRS